MRITPSTGSRELLRLLFVISWGVCLVARGYALVMERFWNRRRECQIEELRRKSG
jgi:hypothetical protein